MWIFSHRSRSSGSTLFSPRRRRAAAAGFTVIEMVVVFAIMIVITALILFRHGQFNSSTLLRTLGYSVALSIRQAQVYGVAVRESTLGSSQFAAGYGIEFTTSNPNQYYLFADLNQNGRRDSGEDLPVYTIAQGYRVSRLCGNLIAGTENCSLTSLTIYFQRPNPEACFASDVSPGACAPTGTLVYDGASVQLQTSSGTTRSVLISLTGQIIVGAPGT